jgi:hypothetical protein
LAQILPCFFSNFVRQISCKPVYHEPDWAPSSHSTLWHPLLDHWSDIDEVKQHWFGSCCLEKLVVGSDFALLLKFCEANQLQTCLS